MASMRTNATRWAVLLAFCGGLPGCIAAGAAAAGAGTGVYLTSRGAESLVDGSVDEVERRARAVFEAEGIPVTGSQMEKSGDKRELKGTKGDLEITVNMERQGPNTTKTEVSARKNLVSWDKDYAQQLLARIVSQK
jgi:peroxiredoxin family protein